MADQDRSRWEQQLRDAARHAEEDLRRVITYINDEVVPDIRQNGSEALRFAARELDKLAQRMDDRRAGVPERPGAAGSTAEKPKG